MRHRLACDPPFVKPPHRTRYERVKAWIAASQRLGVPTARTFEQYMLGWNSVPALGSERAFFRDSITR